MAERRAYVRNAADPSQVKRSVETTARRRTRELSELRETASTQSGARVLWRLLESCGIHKLSFSLAAPSDPLRTAFNEGARNVGNQLLAELFEADPDAYLRMQKDAAKIDETITEPKARSADPLEVDDDDGN